MCVCLGVCARVCARVCVNAHRAIYHKGVLTKIGRLTNSCYRGLGVKGCLLKSVYVYLRLWCVYLEKEDID